MLVILFIVTQAFYFLAYLVEIYFFSLPVNWVKWDYRDRPASHPYIVLFYPVLDELESTMRTTIGA
ncbi:MAG: glycosyl transferase, partial [Lysobacteraceae bacterium]